jgi:hypothetical protein
MSYRRIAVVALALSALPACWAQQPASTFATKARDDASLYVSTGNFIVGRIARECLSLVGRMETPQQFVSEWQRRNSRYVAASAKYMDKRVEEVAASGGPEKRDAIVRELRIAVQNPGEAVVRNMLGNDHKAETCMRAVTLLDTGALDISSKTPMYADLEALVRWAEQ